MWLTCPRCGTKMIGSTYVPNSPSVFPILQGGLNHPMASMFYELLERRKGVECTPVDPSHQSTMNEFLVGCPKRACARNWPVDPYDVYMSLLAACRTTDLTAQLPTSHTV